MATGFPYTPATEVHVDTEEDARGRLVPVLAPYYDTPRYIAYRGGLEALHAERLDHYARVDLRITHQPGGPAGRWSWYAEVINLLNRDNALDVEHFTDYGLDRAPTSNRDTVGGFPIIPSFGVRVRF